MVGVGVAVGSGRQPRDICCRERAAAAAPKSSEQIGHVRVWASGVNAMVEEMWFVRCGALCSSARYGCGRGCAAAAASSLVRIERHKMAKRRSATANHTIVS